MSPVPNTNTHTSHESLPARAEKRHREARPVPRPLLEDHEEAGTGRGHEGSGLTPPPYPQGA